MGEETKDQRLVRNQHEASRKKPKHEHKHKHKPKPHPKQTQPGKKPVARAPDEKPRPRSPEQQRTTAPALVDASEHRRESEDGRKEPKNPVGVGLEWLDYLSLACEAKEGRTLHGASYAELAEDMAEESSEMWKPGAMTTFAEAGGTAGSALLSAVNVAGGMFEMYEGVKEYEHNKADGLFGVAEGLATTTSGVAGVMSLGGVASAGPAAPLAGSVALGLKVGHHGDQQVKEMGWMHDSTGEAVTASDWAADQGQLSEDKIERLTGSHALGVAAGMVTTVDAGIAGGVVAGAAAGNEKLLQLEAFGQERGRRSANLDRADQYALMDTGFAVRDPITGQVKLSHPGTEAARVGAKQMADYDDQAIDAVDRSKLLHPERWGQAPNELSTINNACEQMYAATHKK